MNRNRIEVEVDFYCDAMVVTLEKRAKAECLHNSCTDKVREPLNILSFIKYTKGRCLTKENHHKKEQANCQDVSVFFCCM